MPFRHVLLELLEGFLHFDSKSFRTLSALLFRPGFLTNEFKAGRRSSYVPPIRLYVFVSFVFFLLLTWGSGGNHQAESAGDPPQANQLNLTLSGIKSQELRGLSDSQVDSLLQSKGVKLTTFNRYLAHQIRRISVEGRAQFNHRLLKGVSYMMFALMPIFALLLYLFYRKRADYYIDALVFSVHFHAFAFLLFALYLFVARVIDPGSAILATPLILALYVYAGSRSVYHQSRWLTAGKTAGMVMLYGVSVIGCLLLTVLASIVLS